MEAIKYNMQLRQTSQTQQEELSGSERNHRDGQFYVRQHHLAATNNCLGGEMATLNIMKISLQSGDLKQILQEPVRSLTFVARKFSTFSEKDTGLPADEFLRCSLSVVFKHLFFKTVSERKLLKNTWPKMKNVLFPRLCNCVEYCITTKPDLLHKFLQMPMAHV